MSKFILLILIFNFGTLSWAETATNNRCLIYMSQLICESNNQYSDFCARTRSESLSNYKALTFEQISQKEYRFIDKNEGLEINMTIEGSYYNLDVKNSYEEFSERGRLKKRSVTDSLAYDFMHRSYVYKPLTPDQTGRHYRVSCKWRRQINN